MGMWTFLRERNFQDTHLTLGWRQLVSNTVLGAWMEEGRCVAGQFSLWDAHSACTTHSVPAPQAKGSGPAQEGPPGLRQCLLWLVRANLVGFSPQHPVLEHWGLGGGKELWPWFRRQRDGLKPRSPVPHMPVPSQQFSLGSCMQAFADKARRTWGWLWGMAFLFLDNRNLDLRPSADTGGKITFLFLGIKGLCLPNGDMWPGELFWIKAFF